MSRNRRKLTLWEELFTRTNPVYSTSHEPELLLNAPSKRELAVNWEAIGAIAEMCGSLAVLITLIYLAYQLKQQNKVTRAQIEQQRADSVNQVAAGFLAGDNKDLMTRALLDEKLGPADLTPQELVHLKVALSPLRANLENAYQQHKSGFISDELYEDVSKKLYLAYGNMLMRFELPMTKGFRKELTETLRTKVSN